MVAVARGMCSLAWRFIQYMPSATRMSGQKRRSRMGVSGCAHPARTARRRTPIARRSAPRAILPKFIREAVSRAPHMRKRRRRWSETGARFLGLEKWGGCLDPRGLHGSFRIHPVPDGGILLNAKHARVCALALTLALSMSQAPFARAEDGEDLLGKLQFHGYGEFHYNNPRIDTMSSGAGNVLDVHRFVLGWEYEFTENIRVEAELDYEHAAKELELEEAYLEYDLLPALSLRVGTLLMPVGSLNETHEPPLYYSVERPYVERYIIPTTWQENGAGVVGQTSKGRVRYRAYVTAGLDAVKITSLGGLHDVSS